MTSTPSRSRASTRMSRPGAIAPTSARGGAVGGFASFNCEVLLIGGFCFWPADAGGEKTHDRCQPWVVVEIVRSTPTGPDGAVCYDDDQQVDLLNIANHGGENNP